MRYAIDGGTMSVEIDTEAPKKRGIQALLHLMNFGPSINPRKGKANPATLARKKIVP
jgi:hypothetical protein